MSTPERAGFGRTARDTDGGGRSLPWDLLGVWLDLECGASGAEVAFLRPRQSENGQEVPFLLITHSEPYGLCSRTGRPATGDVPVSPAGFPIESANIACQPRATGLGRQMPGIFAVCYFASLPWPEEYRRVSERLGQFVVVCAGQIVAVARSLRSSAFGATVWVETEPGHRRRGYGRQVCAAWGHRQLAEGRAAFYCYSWGNVVSKRLAESLGLAVLASGLWR